MFSNELDNAQLERLALLSEEAGEVVGIIGKIIRHGFDSYDPTTGGDDNRALLEKEIGDFQNAVQMLLDAGDISKFVIDSRQAKKASSIGRWLHHQGKAWTEGE